MIKSLSIGSSEVNTFWIKHKISSKIPDINIEIEVYIYLLSIKILGSSEIPIIRNHKPVIDIKLFLLIHLTIKTSWIYFIDSVKAYKSSKGIIAET
jgi:hypothetical protein